MEPDMHCYRTVTLTQCYVYLCDCRYVSVKTMSAVKGSNTPVVSQLTVQNVVTRQLRRKNWACPVSTVYVNHGHLLARVSSNWVKIYHPTCHIVAHFGNPVYYIRCRLAEVMFSPQFCVSKIAEKVAGGF